MHNQTHFSLRFAGLNSRLGESIDSNQTSLSLIAIGLTATVLFGVSSSSDRVFAVEALLAGLGAEAFIRLRLKRRLMLLTKPPISLFAAWPILCLYVFLARPFE